MPPEIIFIDKSGRFSMMTTDSINFLYILLRKNEQDAIQKIKSIRVYYFLGILASIPRGISSSSSLSALISGGIPVINGLGKSPALGISRTSTASSSSSDEEDEVKSSSSLSFLTLGAVA